MDKYENRRGQSVQQEWEERQCNILDKYNHSTL